MAPGPVPKPKAERRTRHVPRAGDWIDLEPLEAPILEGANPRWVAAAKRLWMAIRTDPISAQYSDADIQALKETFNEWGELAHAEQRRRLETFGVTPKGRQDLRWRTPQYQRAIKDHERKEAAVRQLRVVADEEDKP